MIDAFRRTAGRRLRPAATAWRRAALATALSLLAAGCAHAPQGATPGSAIEVLQVDAAVLDDSAGRDAALRAACRGWRLSKRQVAAFFAAAHALREGERHDFYWLPCTIGGRLRADGREWTFSIDAAATALWRDGGTVREWGCDAPACEPLVLLMPDQGTENRSEETEVRK